MALTKITTNIIADDAVTADKIAAGAIDSTHVTGLSTSDIGEGTNLYFTDARVGSYLTTNSYATESYVTTAVSNLVDAAPATLDTLNELAAALGDDANFSTTVTNSIATKVSKSGDTITGNLDIVGTLTTDGVTSSERITISNTTSPELRFYDANNVNTDFLIYSPDGTNSLQIKAGSGQEDAFYLSSSGAIAFYDSTGTNQSFYWDSTNERLGLGTTSPSAKLGVNATAPDFTFLQSDVVKFRSGVSGVTNGGVTGSTSGDYFARTTGGKMLFSVDDGVTAHAAITSAGNVGIGTTSPSYKLEVDGGSAETRLRVSTTGTDADEAGIILANSSKTAFNDGIQIAHGAGITSFRGLTGSLYMAIDGSTSRIGVGTSSPTAKLHIIPGASSGTIPGVRVDKDWGSIDGAMVKFDGNPSGGGDGNVLLVKGGGTRTDVETFEVQNGSGTTFVVKGSGDVGIGTASPGTRLHVVGATTTTGLANNIVASWFLTGSYTQNTWYTLTDRAAMISLGYGEGIYQFHCYASCFHAGISLYQTAHIYEEFYLQNVASNGASTHEFRRGPAFGHAVNAGHDAIGLRYRETYGGANNAPLIEWSPKAGGLSNLSTSAGYQLFFYLRRVG